MPLFNELKRIVNLSAGERDIRDYILKNPEKIAGFSTRDLGKATLTSAATVTRFCQKLDCKGYPDFKLRFLSELKRDNPTAEETHIQISERENIVSIIQKVTDLQRQAVEETKAELSLEQMVRVGRLLQEADYIDFYAYDANIHLAEYGCNQFFHAGKVANTYSKSNIQGLSALIHEKQHLAVLLSHTGENSRLKEIARMLKRSETKIIVISSGKEQTLAKCGDEYLYAAGSLSVDQLWMAKFFASAKYLLDVMFVMTFSAQYKDNMKLNQSYEKFGKETLWGLLKDI